MMEPQQVSRQAVSIPHLEILLELYSNSKDRETDPWETI